MFTQRKTILLTGATGVVGRALVDELSGQHHVVCLQHRTPVADPRVQTVTGDLAAPALGLTRHDRARLAAQVDVVVHAAATTSWRAAPEEVRATNRDGTRSALGFARLADATLFHVSTAYLQAPDGDASRYTGPRAYVDSKLEAEQLTRDSDVPTVILRPSIVIGNSTDGRMSAFQGLHRLAGLIARGAVPIVACESHSLVDTVPQDVVARVVADLVRRDVRDGEYWLTAGEQAMTSGDIIASALAVGRAAGLPAHPPRFVAAEAVDRLVIPLLDDVLTPALRATFTELLELAWLFQVPAALPTSLPELGFGHLMTRDRLRDTFDLSMRCWAGARGLLERIAS
jgi:nucleoside-diphosphate-sugar epimerase